MEGSSSSAGLALFKQGRSEWSAEKGEAVPGWPTRTEVCCFWCCHPFDSVPIPAPRSYHPRKKRWRVGGTFCSWACAKAYMLDRPNYQQASLLPLLRKHATGLPVSSGIKPAPPKTALKMFGGPMTIEQFRADSRDSGACFREMPANVMLDVPVLTLVPTSTPKSRGLLPRPLNFDNLTPGVRNETLRLKRPTPARSKQNNMLERIFGIAA